MSVTDFRERGFGLFKGVIDKTTLYQFVYYKERYDFPMRGHDHNGKYYDKPSDDVNWANYWTPSLNNEIKVNEVAQSIDHIICELMDDPIFYHSDMSVLTPNNSLIRPHVDTPHRHSVFNERIEKLLGVQVAIPLSDFGGDAGSTAFLPESHTRFWDIQKCYAGEYTAEFMEHAEQPKADFGDALIWDARTLHSQMPNVTETNRYMLLMNYVERSIVPELMEYESSLLS